MNWNTYWTVLGQLALAWVVLSLPTAFFLSMVMSAVRRNDRKVTTTEDQKLAPKFTWESKS